MKTSKETNTTILTKSKKQFNFSALSVGFIGSKKAKQIEVITADDRTFLMLIPSARSHLKRTDTYRNGATTSGVMKIDDSDKSDTLKNRAAAFELGLT